MRQVLNEIAKTLDAIEDRDDMLGFLDRIKLDSHARASMPPEVLSQIFARGKEFNISESAVEDSLQGDEDPTLLDSWPNIGEASLDGFPVDVLPQPYQGYCTELAEELQVDTSMIMAMMLGIVAGCGQKAIDIHIRGGWVEPMCLYVVGFAEAAQRKTAVINAVRSPMDKWQREANQKLSSEISKSRARRDLLEQKSRMMLQRHRTSMMEGDGDSPAQQSDATSYEDAVGELEEHKMVVPHKISISSNQTPEAMADIACNRSGGTMTIVSDEGMSLFSVGTGGRYSAGGGGHFEFLLQGHTGSSFEEVRKTAKSAYVSKLCVSVAALTQPGVVRDIIAGDTQMSYTGLLARFMYVWPTSNLGYRKLSPRTVSQGMEDAYDACVARILTACRPERPIEGEELPRIHRIVVDEGAQEILHSIRREAEIGLRSTGSLRSIALDWGGKYAGLVIRLAGVLALMRWSASTRDMHDLRIEVRDLTGAWEIGKAAQSHAARMFVTTELGHSETFVRKHLAKLAKQAMPRIEVMSARDIYRAGNRTAFKKQGLATKSALEPILERLESHSCLRKSKDRPNSWEINPKLAEEHETTFSDMEDADRLERSVSHMRGASPRKHLPD